MDAYNKTILPSAARTTLQTGTPFPTGGRRHCHVVVDMTVVGTGSITVTINGYDPLSGKKYAILAGAAIVTNSTNVYKVGPGLPATANVSANDCLPSYISVDVAVGNANSATYSINISLM